MFTGNSFSSRLYELLASGAAVLRQHTLRKAFWFDLLAPWQQYIPLDNDASDTVPTLQTLRTLPFLQQRVGASAMEFVATYLSPPAWHEYARTLLQGTAALQIKPWTDEGKKHYRNYAPMHPRLMVVEEEITEKYCAALEVADCDCAGVEYPKYFNWDWESSPCGYCECPRPQ